MPAKPDEHSGEPPEPASEAEINDPGLIQEFNEAVERGNESVRAAEQQQPED